MNIDSIIIIVIDVVLRSFQKQSLIRKKGRLRFGRQAAYYISLAIDERLLLPPTRLSVRNHRNNEIMFEIHPPQLCGWRPQRLEFCPQLLEFSPQDYGFRPQLLVELSTRPTDGLRSRLACLRRPV